MPGISSPKADDSTANSRKWVGWKSVVLKTHKGLHIPMTSRMQIYIYLDTGADFPIIDPALSESAHNDGSSNIDNIGATPTPKIEEQVERNDTDTHNHVPVPQLQHVGKKRTLLLNCTELSGQLNRTSKQITDFLVYTVGTSGSFVDQGHFAMRGRFQKRQIERALKQFVGKCISMKKSAYCWRAVLSLGASDQYLVCHHCNTWSTILEDCEDKGRLLLRCVECDYSQKVPEIKAYKGCRGVHVGRRKPNDKVSV